MPLPASTPGPASHPRVVSLSLSICFSLPFSVSFGSLSSLLSSSHSLSFPFSFFHSLFLSLSLSPRTLLHSAPRGSFPRSWLQPASRYTEKEKERQKNREPEFTPVYSRAKLCNRIARESHPGTGRVRDDDLDGRKHPRGVLVTPLGFRKRTVSRRVERLSRRAMLD